MKITKRQLKRIIKEEKAKVLSESQTAGPPIGGDHAIALGGSYGGPDLNYDSVSSADKLPAEPHSWAKAMDGDVDRDEEGQTIIFLSKELHPDVNSFERDLPQDWDYEESYDGGSFIVYTGLYPGGAPNERAYTPKMESRKITRGQLKKIIKEEKAKLLAEIAPIGSATGDDISDRMYRQALDLFGPDAIIDEENGELYIDTGLVDDDVEALYADWINLWPDAMHEEGGLVYTGVSV